MSNYLGYQVFATLLIPDRDKRSDLKNTVGYTLRVLLYIFAPIALFSAIAVITIFFLGEENLATVFSALMYAIAITFLLATPLLFTYLPAYVAGYGQGIGLAIACGFRQYGYILSQSTGASIAFILLFGLVILIFFPFAPSDLALQMASSKGPDLSIWLVTLIIFFSAIVFYSLLVNHVIAARAFLLDNQPHDRSEELNSQQRARRASPTRPVRPEPHLNSLGTPAFGRR